MNFKAHLFICTNQKDGKPCCADKQAELLQQELKSRFKGNSAVRINKSGCLDQCSQGSVAVLYPQGKWFLNLTIKDADLLEKEIKSLL